MNVLIVGYGSIGKRHFDILSQLPEVNCIAIVSRQKVDHIKIFTSLEQVRISEYNYIIIASETAKHYKHLKYIESQVSNKIILVEKPLFATNEIVEIKNNQVFVAYNRRFYPILNQIKSLIEEDNCYYMHVITGQYLPQWRPDRDYRHTYSAMKNGGGVLFDLSHEIDYINYLCGEMKIISAVNEKISDLEIESDDIAIILAKTENNVLVNFSIDYISKEFIQNIVVHLQDSTLIANLLTMQLEQIFKDGSKRHYDFSRYEKNYSFAEMHKDILFYGQTNVCTYQEGLNIMNTIFHIRNINNEN